MTFVTSTSAPSIMIFAFLMSSLFHFPSSAVSVVFGRSPGVSSGRVPSNRRLALATAPSKRGTRQAPASNLTFIVFSPF
jgi:hypothetical protein